MDEPVKRVLRLLARVGNRLGRTCRPARRGRRGPAALGAGQGRGHGRVTRSLKDQIVVLLEFVDRRPGRRYLVVCWRRRDGGEGIV